MLALERCGLLTAWIVLTVSGGFGCRTLGAVATSRRQCHAECGALDHAERFAVSRCTLSMHVTVEAV
jgi:hypothetical protein